MIPYNKDFSTTLRFGRNDKYTISTLLAADPVG